MKYLLSISLLCLIFCTQSFAFQRQRLDDGWHFSLGDDAQWASPSYDDSHWCIVDLPHDWSVEGQFAPEEPAGMDGGYLQTGIGWYRLKLKNGEDYKVKNSTLTKLYFEGVYMNSTVYLNGDSIGGHPYGYSSFWIDITDKIKDGDNIIAVRVDNSQQKNCRWYTGSGIYRHVWLYRMDPQQMDDPWKLYIRTGQIYGINADATMADSATLLITYGDQWKETRTYHDVKLWSPEHPVLYPIKVGNLSIEHGFREVSFSASGMTLNGQSYLLNGGCVHHDNGCIGAAALDDAEWRKAKLMKEAGFNAVRTSHNPPSEEFIRACDHLGVMVIDEAFDGLRAKKNAHDYHKYIDRWWQNDVDALVLRDRNHPSVIAWSNGNEVYERKKIEIITTTRKLTRRMHQLDPSRPVTQALCEVDSIFDPQAEELDIVGYNYLIDHASKDHQRCPERIIWQTESYPDSAFQSWSGVQDMPYVLGDFVWTAIDYLGESSIGRTYYPSDPAARGEHWQGGSKFPWHGAYCGDIDVTGLRKPISYYRQTLWDTIPNLHIGVREPNLYVDSILCTRWSTWPTTQSWTWPGHEGKPIEVEIYSRYPKVALYLNDELIGKQEVSRDTRYKAAFTLPYKAGTLKAVGLSDGLPLASKELQTASTAYALRLTPDKTVLQADGQSLSYVVIELIDQAGNVLPFGNDALTISLKGNGTLLAVGNADMTSTDSYAAHRAANRNTAATHLWHGRALAVIRSGHKTGTLTLTISSAGLKAKTNLVIR